MGLVHLMLGKTTFNVRIFLHRMLDFSGSCCRTGVGPEPHSVWALTLGAPDRTDLDAEVNRSRCGTEPISTRNSTDLGEGGGVVHRL